MGVAKKTAQVLYYFAVVITCGAFLLLALIAKTIVRYCKNDRLIRSSIKKIDKMNGKDFENYLCVLFSELGYGVTKTKSSNDYGADLILRKNFKRIVVQAKRYSHAVSVNAVQEVSSAKQYYKATSAWVVTNSTFTHQAKQLAKKTQVKLLNRTDLIALSKKANKWR